jgi:gallate decarboxylase subunit D
MKQVILSRGKGRTKVSLSATRIGEDLIVFLFNKQGHLGATAMSDYSHADNRASTSVLTRLGHKDDSIAYKAAHTLCKRLKKPVCAIAGIHVDNITEAEIAEVIQNCEALVERLCRQLSVDSRQH